jgi:hypothetical protein
VDLRHTLLNRAAEITATEMDVLHRGSNILVACEACDPKELPA